MKSKPHRVPDYLLHILEAIHRINRYVAGMLQADFAANSMVQDAVIRNLEIMGEAARNIESNDPSFSTAHPAFPLRDVYLMRNRLSHGYFTVDLTIVWNTIQNDLPELEKQADQLHKTLTSSAP